MFNLIDDPNMPGDALSMKKIQSSYLAGYNCHVPSLSTLDCIHPVVVYTLIRILLYPLMKHSVKRLQNGPSLESNDHLTNESAVQVSPNIPNFIISRFSTPYSKRPSSKSCHSSARPLLQIHKFQQQISDFHDSSKMRDPVQENDDSNSLFLVNILPKLETDISSVSSKLWRIPQSLGSKLE